MSLLQLPRKLFRQELRFPMDSIKMEKAKAMEGFTGSRHRTLKNFTLLFELCLGLVTASWLLTCVFTWIPLAVRFAADHLSSSNLAVFLFCNAVILLIVFLSSLTGSTAAPRENIYDEFVSASQARRRPESPAAPEDKNTHESGVLVSGLCSVSLLDETVEKTEHALAPGANSTEPMAPEAKSAESEVDSAQLPAPGAEPVQKLEPEAEPTEPLAVKVYQRTQSDKSGMEIVERKSEKELRRSETGRPRRRRAAVEELSNEEFRLKIEAFIAAQKCNLMKEHKCTDMVLRGH